MKVVRLTLAEELEKERAFWGRAESSEHGSTKFCAFCPSTITEYSKSCLWSSDFDEIFAPKNRHGYVKALWASGGFIR